MEVSSNTASATFFVDLHYQCREHMKRNTTQNNLENIKVQPIAMSHHRTELRRALLTSPYWERKQIHTVLFWKGGEAIMKKNKLITGGIAFAVIVLTVVSLSGFMPKASKTAYAEAQKSYDAVSTLSLEQQNALKHQINIDDPKAMLQKAKNAKDLKILTYEQFASQYPVPPGGKSPDGKAAPDLHSLNFLQFTNTNGAKVVLGVDPKSDLPVLILEMQGDPSKGNAGFSTEKGGSFGLPSQGKHMVQFDSSDKKTTAEGTINAGGQGIFIVDGKKYKVPEGTKISTNAPPSIKIEGNDVYINGTKATPQE